MDDLLRLDERLNGDQRLIRDTVKSLRRRPGPAARRRLVRGGHASPRASSRRELGALGLLGMHLDGLRLRRHGRAVVRRGLPRAGGRRLRAALASSPCRARWRCSPIWRYGSEEQKQQWLPRMAAGEAIGCFGLTEPDHGSDPAAMRTYAKRDGATGCSTARKMWITNGSIADVAVVWAQTDDGIRGFVVPTDTPGLHRPRDPQEDVPAGLGHLRARTSTTSGCPPTPCFPTSAG